MTDFYVEHFTRVCWRPAQGRVDLVFTADDIAGQNGLLMSLAMWEKFIKPYHVRLNGAIHELRRQGHLPHRRRGDGGGRRADRHGHRRPAGAAVQRRRGWTRRCSSSASATGSASRAASACRRRCPSAARTTCAEVEQLIRVLGKDGGYILGPSHAIQAGTPPENIVAMFDTASDFYPF